MPSNNEQLQPTPFDVAQPIEPQPLDAKATARKGTPPWILPALGGLLLLAVLVIFWLPERVAAPGQEETSTAPQPTTSTTDGTPGAANSTATSRPPATTADASPWSEAQLAKLRNASQDVLAELLDIQSALQERGVEQWAPERYAAAAAIAAAGDEFYKTREYEQATERYQEALDALQALQQGIPGELAAQLKQARQAIEDGEPETASTALDRASLLEPDSPELATLHQRAAALPQLLPLLAQAEEAEQNRDLALAEQLLQQATALDPLHLRARRELQRIAAAYQEQRFNDAMSEGYAALDEGRFDSARKAFRSARQLQEGSSEANSALQEVATAETAYRLASLKQRGDKDEQSENWQEAVSAYEQAQKIDSNVLFAAEGLKRSRARAQLDKQFRATLLQPERLADVAVAESTEQLLRHAQKIQPRGPVLQQQISRIEQLLQQANTTVAVTLRSDEETEVIVYKVKRLGRFAQQELVLRPGTYTAVGTRNGYRDVRQDFTITPGNASVPITIACTEPI
ncbi:MAG: hypothetical protein V7700_05285 [Halioglobus sp.]